MRTLLLLYLSNSLHHSHLLIFSTEVLPCTSEEWDEMFEEAVREVEGHKGGYFNNHMAWAMKPLKGGVL